VSAYVEDLKTQSGKQHYLDRVEAGTMSVTLNNRTGAFWNTVALSVRMPIAVTATWPQTGGTQYNVFFGFIDSIEEKLLDQLNSELVVSASDYLKFLSLRRMSSASFWPTYANSTNTRRWYRLDTTPSAAVTFGQAISTTQVTYTAVNTFTAGQQVTISGLGIQTGSNLNLNNVTIASSPAPSATQFTVNTTGITSGSTSTGSGVAYRTSAPDLGSDNAGGTLIGQLAFQNYGALIYDIDNCVDLANGSTTGSGALAMPIITTAIPAGGIDFWILGQNITPGVAFAKFWVTISGTPQPMYFSVNFQGQFTVTANGVLQATSTTSITDGYWHHIGVTLNSSGNLALYCDGNFVVFGTNGSLTSFHSNGQVNYIGFIPGSGVNTGYTLPALIDEVVVSTTSVTVNEVLNRYRAGTLLQLGFPVTSTNVPGTSTTKVSSGDRIAEILTLAGFGSISSGQVVLNNNLYYINESSTAWSIGTGNGYVDVEPYYWDSPVTTSSALDLILQVCDTDIGTFWQRPDGTLNFNNQNFYGSWSWNTSTQKGTWTPNTYTSDTYHTWTDQDGSNTPYVGPSTQLVIDDTDLWTLVRITPQSGVAQVYENTSAETTYGLTVLEKSSTVHSTLDAAMSTAHYLGYLYQNPLTRMAAIELRADSSDGAYNKALFTVGIGDVVTVKRIMPGQTTGTTSQMVVESVSHNFVADPGQWSTTFILDPYPLRGAGSA
jgi:hypothetical protein